MDKETRWQEHLKRRRQKQIEQKRMDNAKEEEERRRQYIDEMEELKDELWEI